ncbi:MAG TPA: hypothetical protein VIL49_16440 [Capillimicrobium sp.]|jgi:hypothetical protein
MRRTAATLTTLLASLLLLAPAALAHDGGMGTYGEADDKVVTNAGFLVIAFFPAIILLFSVLQWQLDKRKARRKAASKKLAPEWRGGW